MGFWQLYIFMQVYEQSSFSEAARLCGISQPTVSTHIRQLEKHLDVVLFDRVTKKRWLPRRLTYYTSMPNNL